MVPAGRGNLGTLGAREPPLPLGRIRDGDERPQIHEWQSSAEAGQHESSSSGWDHPETSTVRSYSLQVNAGGRYRYNLDEVLQSLTSVNAEQSLSRPVLDGGLGAGRSAADSAAYVLGRAVSAHVREATPRNQEVSHAGVPAALWVLLRSTSRRAVALA